MKRQLNVSPLESVSVGQFVFQCLYLSIEPYIHIYVLGIGNVMERLIVKMEVMKKDARQLLPGTQQWNARY